MNVFLNISVNDDIAYLFITFTFVLLNSEPLKDVLKPEVLANVV